MTITGLNHLTLAVSDLERSVKFYSELLGFSLRMRGPSSAYLESGSLWLALVADASVRRGPLPEYTHVAFSVASSGLPAFTQRLADAGVVLWQQAPNAESFYFLDPDGHKLELYSGDIRARLAARAALREPGVTLYDLPPDARQPLANSANRFSKWAAYVLSAAFVVLGIYGLIAEYAERKTSQDILFGYVLGGVFLVSGSLIYVATRWRYAGGAWFFLAILFFAIGISGTSIEIDDWLRESQHHPSTGVAIASSLFALGSFFLVLGHLRHRRRNFRA